MATATVSPAQLALLRRLVDGDLTRREYLARPADALVRLGFAHRFNQYIGGYLRAACLRATPAGHLFAATNPQGKR